MPLPLEITALSVVKFDDVMVVAAPVIVSCFVPIKVVIVVAKFASSFSAAANSLSVSKVAGAESIKFVT